LKSPRRLAALAAVLLIVGPGPAIIGLQSPVGLGSAFNFGWGWIVLPSLLLALLVFVACIFYIGGGFAR